MQLRKRVVRGLLVAITMVSFAALVGCGSDDENTEPAGAINAANRVFTFSDGAAFGLSGPVSLEFDANGTGFTLVSGSDQATGTAVFASLTLTIVTSTIPGLQEGGELFFPTAEIITSGDEVGSLLLTNDEGVSTTSDRPITTGTGGS